MERGKFIVLDGMDNSGKSTQMNLLSNYIFSKDKTSQVFRTREPTRNSLWGRMLLDVVLRSNTNPREDRNFITYLFLKDREKHITEIKEQLKKVIM